MESPSGRPRHVIRLAEAGGRKASAFDIRATEREREAVAAELGIPAVNDLRLSGRLVPEGRQDWRLEAELAATVVQESVVSLEPVTTRIEEPVARRYIAGFEEPTEGEVEMPSDEVEALPQSLDVAEVMVEALALALPPYPRAEGEELGETVVTEQGAEPLTEERAKPFAALKDAFKPRE
jgi:uncharacterized metal-binding protein YceD (DUF177 family)